MFWSQPKPCASSMGGPSGRPDTETLLRATTSIAPDSMDRRRPAASGAPAAASVAERTARVGALDDLRLGVAVLLHDEVAVGALHDVLDVGQLVAVEDR